MLQLCVLPPLRPRTPRVAKGPNHPRKLSNSVLGRHWDQYEGETGEPLLKVPRVRGQVCWGEVGPAELEGGWGSLGDPNYGRAKLVLLGRTPVLLGKEPMPSPEAGQDGAPMVHVASLRALLRALPCLPAPVPVSLGFLPCVMLHTTVVIPKRGNELGSPQGFRMLTRHAADGVGASALSLLLC